MRELFRNPDLITVEKPARYTNSEWNSVHKEIAPQDCLFALAFPDSYEIAQSGLGLQILYQAINSHPRAKAERVCAPMPDMQRYLKEHSYSLGSLESGTPLHRFDVIGFTLQYQMTYTNVLLMLESGGIPLRSRNRNAEDPLIIGGGPCSFNPEPVADFFDAILIGDGEEAVHEIIDTYLAWKDRGRGDRKLLLRDLAKINGMYVPSFYEPRYGNDGVLSGLEPVVAGAPPVIRKRVLADLDSSPIPTSPIVPYLQTVHDRVMLEIFRGCSRGCRYCHAGFIYRPIRERSVESILKAAEDSIASTGYDEISLLALSCTDYTRIGCLLGALGERYGKRGVTVSIPSVRMDTSSLDLARMIETSRKRGLTFAPEAGTQRLRDVINKNITEEDIFTTLNHARNLGWRMVKLYFMIGLPLETDDDIDGLVDLVHRIRRETNLELHVSVSHFVPQPFTPFQWEEMESMASLRSKAYYLKDQLRHRKIRLNWHEPATSMMEGVFARGDRKLSSVIEAAYKSGCQFDGWSEYFDYNRWLGAFREQGINPEEYLRKRSPDECLPWSHIDAGVSLNYLKSEHKRAYSGETTTDCRGTCVECGVCFDLGVSNTFAPPTHSENTGMPDIPDIHDRQMRIRVRLSKCGGIRWVSHLDMQRVVERTLRRAGIPVSYTEGFHPRPRVSFLLPLPLGYTSESEWVDIQLFRKMPMEEVRKNISDALPPGTSILDIQEVEFGEKSLTKFLLQAEFEVRMPSFPPEETGYVEDRVREFLELEEIIVEKKGRSLNVRGLIPKLEVLRGKESVDLVMDLLVPTDGSVKADQIVEMLFGKEVRHSSHYHRKAVYLVKETGPVKL